MLTQIVAGRVYDFSHVVGRWGEGLGFSGPVKAVLGEGDLIYVLNRGYEVVPIVPWNRAGRTLRVNMLNIGKVPGDEELVGEFSKYGDTPGQLIWPAGIALDSTQNVYVTDEWMNRVSIFDREGNFLRLWGSPGESDGQFNRPSGIVVDGEDNLYIVDTFNNRVQKFTGEGKYLSQWGIPGSGEGEFQIPWGITTDIQGNVYVADFNNHRVQKFTPDGEYLAQFGSYGSGRGELNRPSDVAVDPDGDVYVCDWANNRVQVFGPEGQYITGFTGDAQELSKWAKMTVDTSPETIKRRREVRSLESEWRFAFPTGVTFDPKKNRLIVADSQRHRLQIYNKVQEYVEPQRAL